MVYRIRYISGGVGQHEAVIEANNTAEALVKFSHAQTAMKDCRGRQEVTSIAPDTPLDDLLVEVDFGSVR